MREVCDWLVARAGAPGARQRHAPRLAVVGLRRLTGDVAVALAARGALDNQAHEGGRAPEPGYVATGAVLFETDNDGQPLYRLRADRIAQPPHAPISN